MKTEAQLWDALKRQRDADLIHYTTLGFNIIRFETAIHLGVADCEYVSPGAHGWVELKVGILSRRRKGLRLREPFKTEQAQWLLAHNNPKIDLRSWLLIGIDGPTTFEKYLLLEPEMACAFLQHSIFPYDLLIRDHRVRVLSTARGVLDNLCQQGAWQ